MNSCLPVRISDTQFEVVVDNEIQREKMMEEASSLVEFIRRKLKNTQISLVVQVSQQEKKKVFSKREILEELLSENNTLTELVAKYDLIIA